MNLRGLQPFSLIDYPGKIACVVFAGNCNLLCPYCHNPCLVLDPESQPEISETQFFNFLERRHERLDGVVISGGEPSLRQGLLNFIKEIKQRGFLVKLDTNGSFPERIFKIHREVGLDALGVDYKAPAARYNEITRSNIAMLAEKVLSVIEFAVKEGIKIDVRTTVHRALLDESELKIMRQELSNVGVREWVLQQFNPADIVEEELLRQESYSDRELLAVANMLGNTKVRGLRGVFLH